MKARTPTPAPLFEEALAAALMPGRSSPQPLSRKGVRKDARLSRGYGQRGETEAPRAPSPPGLSTQGRPEEPDEGRPSEGGAIEAAIGALDWPAIERDLAAYGCAIAPRLLSSETSRAFAVLYPDDFRFRSRIVMAAHGFGRGEYKYFAYPLPDQIVALRHGFYSRLAPIADRWNETMGVPVRYPTDHEAFLKRCHEAGQTRPTPLLLRYGPGDYNCLHQDVYGEHIFPLQIAILLAEPGRDFTGGEFVLTEQRPRMQSRAEVVSLRQGDGVIFAVRERPVQGTRGAYRVNLRHGVSRIKTGERFTLGVILHDAK